MLEVIAYHEGLPGHHHADLDPSRNWRPKQARTSCRKFRTQ
jgi:hypothetical protein